MSNMKTRDKIVEAADQLFYRQGFEHTSFTDIANAVQISRGNFYYHFKTKDEILDAVIRFRLENTRAMVDQWALDEDTPADRIRSFIHILVANRAKILLYGCPVGTLSAELSKLDHAARADANSLFDLFRVWLRQQFIDLGRAADADALALHLLARSQGVATLASAIHDEGFIDREVAQLCDWLEACAQGREGDASRSAGRGII